MPIGTVVYELPEEGGEAVQLADLVEDGKKVRIAAGGQGGRGNARFASSTNRAPRRADPGTPGEVRSLRLQLKLLADVGLVGFPNAGKSTLISRISAAKPKIADYPFTTLTPHLGVVALSDDRSFVVADVPGLIEGAHRGLGLGHQFLRHLERTRLLVHMIDVSGQSGRDPVEDFKTIRRELELYRPELAEKPAIAAANKMDAVVDRAPITRLAAHLRRRGIPLHRISAVTGDGVTALVERHVAPPAARGAGGMSVARRVWRAGRHVRSHPPGAPGRRLSGSRRPRPRRGAAAPLAHAAAPAGGPVGFDLPPLRDGGSWPPRPTAASSRATWNWAARAPPTPPTRLRALHATGLEALQIFFLTGADAFAEIATWREYPAVLDLAHFVVCSRAGVAATSLPDRLPQLAARMIPVPAGTVHAGAEAPGLHQIGGGPGVKGPETRVFLLDCATPDVSSTTIRAHARAGRPLAGLVPPEVDDYIRRHRLYGADPGAAHGGRPAAGNLHD